MSVNNPQQPFFETQELSPDRLIAGHFQLITGNGVLTGGSYERGAVLGRNKDGKYVLSKKTATDGSQKPCAILIEDVDAGKTDQMVGVYLTGQFNVRALHFDSSWTAEDLGVELRSQNIFVMDSLPA